MKITILTIISNIFLNLFCSSVQEQRRQEAGVSRSEELPQSMKMRERVGLRVRMRVRVSVRARMRARVRLGVRARRHGVAAPGVTV